MTTIGVFGTGVVGVFQRTLPPRSKVQYDPGYELMLEVKRWFHYRHQISVAVVEETIKDVEHLEAVMLEGYRRVWIAKKRYWHLLQDQAREYIREFKDIFKDVLCEMELTRGA